MQDAALTDPVLERYAEAVRKEYGDRVERIVLFGSRARGDFHEDSDYDVAVFLRGMNDRWAEIKRLARIEVDLMDKTGAFVNSIAYPEGYWEKRTPLMHEVRREGRDL
jgi:uncharacterized protein